MEIKLKKTRYWAFLVKTRTNVKDYFSYGAYLVSKIQQNGLESVSSCWMFSNYVGSINLLVYLLGSGWFIQKSFVQNSGHPKLFQSKCICPKLFLIKSVFVQNLFKKCVRSKLHFDRLQFNKLKLQLVKIHLIEILICFINILIRCIWPIALSQSLNCYRPKCDCPKT